jgi:hypothetical protein
MQGNRLNKPRSEFKIYLLENFGLAENCQWRLAWRRPMKSRVFLSDDGVQNLIGARWPPARSVSASGSDPELVYQEIVGTTIKGLEEVQEHQNCIPRRTQIVGHSD